MREATLKRLLAVFTKIDPDSIFSNPEISKIEPVPPRDKDAPIPKPVKIDTEPPKPEFYKKELFDSPIVVVAESTRKSFLESGENKLPLRKECFEVTKVLKAPESFRNDLNKTKFLQGKFKVPFSNPLSVMDTVRLFRGKEFILFIKDAKVREVEPPFLHCDFGSTIFWTDELETTFENWLSKKKK